MRIAFPPLLLLLLIAVGAEAQNYQDSAGDRGLDASSYRGSMGSQRGGCDSESQGGQSDCMPPMGRGNSKLTATCIAQKAAQEAKQASDTQQPAAEAAARQVKVQLAEKAMSAAKAAEAALAGKQQIVEQLQDEVHEAEAVVQEESASMVGSQSNLEAAATSAKQAKMLLCALNSAIKIAQDNLGNAETAANGASQELTEKMQLVDAARNRVEQLLRQLSVARTDYTNTKKAAYKAACAAAEAHQKATGILHNM